jgi:hypothetical protein
MPKEEFIACIANNNDFANLEITKGILPSNAHIVLGLEQCCCIIRFNKFKDKQLFLNFIEGYEELDLEGECLPVEAPYNNHNCRIMISYNNSQLKNIPNSCDNCEDYSCFKLQYCYKKRELVIEYINRFINKYSLTLYSFN